MIQGLVLWGLTLLGTYVILSLYSGFGQERKPFLIQLFLYHSILALAYYLYALFNPSDSLGYYNWALYKYGGENWFEYFGESTSFIRFIAFFLVNSLGFTYEACMVFFAWLGYLGFVFFYVFFKEHVQQKITWFGLDAVKLIFLLPNLHFWSASLGKGALIFFGFGLFFFGITRPGQRIITLIIGGWIIYMIRPHIFFVMLIGLIIGFTFSIKGVAMVARVLVLLISGALLGFIYNDILTLTGLDDESIIDPLISHRAQELSKATSGIDITSYSIPEKLFAFCFRPLFFDAPGVLGVIVSFENLFYLIMFINLFRPSCLKFLFAADGFVKTGFLTFMGVALALSQITGNLGLAMRQKSQVMILMMFVILKFFESQQKMDGKKFRPLAMLKRKAHVNRLKPMLNG